MAMTVTIVINVNDSGFDKSKLATATAGQGHNLHEVGVAAVQDVARALGSKIIASDVSLTSVTVAYVSWGHDNDSHNHHRLPRSGRCGADRRAGTPVHRRPHE